MTQILAIDPGPAESAFVLWDGQRILNANIVPNEWLLDMLRSHPKEWHGTVLAIEMVACYGMPVGAEVFETCLWIGRFSEAWHYETGRQPVLVKRLEVKSHICHSAKAKDANVRQALIDRLGPHGTKREPGPTYGMRKHLWAALAVAVTVWDRKPL